MVPWILQDFIGILLDSLEMYWFLLESIGFLLELYWDSLEMYCFLLESIGFLLDLYLRRRCPSGPRAAGSPKSLKSIHF